MKVMMIFEDMSAFENSKIYDARSSSQSEQISHDLHHVCDV